MPAEHHVPTKLACQLWAFEVAVVGRRIPKSVPDFYVFGFLFRIDEKTIDEKREIA